MSHEKIQDTMGLDYSGEKKMKTMSKTMLCIGAMALALAVSPSIALADEITVTATVNSGLTATFNYASVAFGALDAGTSDNAAPSNVAGVYNVTVDTNKNFDVAFLGANLTDGGGHSIPITNLKVDENLVAANLAVGDATACSEGSQWLAQNVAASTTIDYHGFWLSIPASQYAAAYTGSVTITYSSVS